MDIEKSIRENQLRAKLHVGKVLGGVDTIEKSVVEDIQKSKPAVAGEIRDWGGKKYKKQPNGKWVEVSEHGMTKKEHSDKAQEHRSNMETSNKKNEGHIYHREMAKRDEHKEISSKLSDKEHSDEELGGVDTIEKSVVEDIQKSKPAVAGETRDWGGKKYKKQPNGKWVEVSESHGMTKKEHEKFANKPGNNMAQFKNHQDRADNLSDKEHDEEELGEEKKQKDVHNDDTLRDTIKTKPFNSKLLTDFTDNNLESSLTFIRTNLYSGKLNEYTKQRMNEWESGILKEQKSRDTEKYHS